MQIFSLTRQEKQVIIFLLAMALAGLGVKFYFKTFIPCRTIRSFNEKIAKVYLNSADKNTLMGLPGVGEKIASRIIDYREKNGNFESIDELKKVKGITNSRYEKISSLIYVE